MISLYHSNLQPESERETSPCHPPLTRRGTENLIPFRNPRPVANETSPHFHDLPRKNDNIPFKSLCSVANDKPITHNLPGKSDNLSCRYSHPVANDTSPNLYDLKQFLIKQVYPALCMLGCSESVNIIPPLRFLSPRRHGPDLILELLGVSPLRLEACRILSALQGSYIHGEIGFKALYYLASHRVGVTRSAIRGPGAFALRTKDKMRSNL